MAFVPAVHLPAHLSRADALWFVFQNGRLLVSSDPAQPLLPEVRDIGWFGFSESRRHYLGELDGKPVFALAAGSDDSAPEGYFFEDFRKLLMQLERHVFEVAGRAVQILEWERSHRFCGRCGAATEFHAIERSVVCPACHFTQYPRINPCVIVLVTRGEELLLARSTRFNLPMYSTLAGFIEAGESAEETLAREVREEVGVEIRNPVYFGSQPWPFPNNLMLGFHAEYAGGELVLQEDEIMDAQFFHYRQLPMIPPPGSIAHALIQDYLRRLDQAKA
jgi:NAD+ diphosphatase